MEMMLRTCIPGVTMKRRPERERPANEVQIKFANRHNLFRAQGKLREVGIYFRPYGVSVFVKEGQAQLANEVLEKNEILLTERKMKFC